jgi:hypothetical protein
VRDAVEVIDRSINWIDHPLKLGGGILGVAFFARIAWSGNFQKQFRDERLGANIKLHLDIVSFFDIDFERPAEVLADQCAGCASALIAASRY